MARASGAEEFLREIRIEMVRRGIAYKDVAAGTGYSEKYVTNTIQGFKSAAPARAKIEAFFGKQFWTK